MNRRHVRTGCLTLPSMEMDGPHFYVFQALLVLVINRGNRVCPCRSFQRNRISFQGWRADANFVFNENEWGAFLSLSRPLNPCNKQR